MSKTYRPYAPVEQDYLFPPSAREWLPKGHLVYVLLDVVRQLDLGGITSYYERERRGAPPHDPRMMTALLLYGYCVGVASSRKLEKRTYEDVAFRLLAGSTHPDHTCISEFRRIHLEALSGLFLQVLRLCQEMGLVRLGHVALDGTKMEANASKHKAMSYDRMRKSEDELSRKVAEILAQAEATDAAEDAQEGQGHRGDQMPAELSHPVKRLERIRAAMAALEAEAKAQAVEAERAKTEDAQVEEVLAEMKNIEAAHKLSDPKDDDDPPPPPSPSPLPRHTVPAKEGAPTEKAQRNFTDADSRIMKRGGDFVQAYNAQAVVDEAHQIIVAADLSNQPPDAEYFVPMLEETIANCRVVPKVATADNGYFSARNSAAATARGVDVYLATGRTKHEPSATPSVEDSAKDAMRAKLATEQGRALYARRKAIVEPVFGQIKNRGLRRFLLRGLAKARGEWLLMALSHNLLKLAAAVRALPTAATPKLAAA